MRWLMPHPCMGSSVSVCRMSRSSVPRRRSDGDGGLAIETSAWHLLSEPDRRVRAGPHAVNGALDTRRHKRRRVASRGDPSLFATLRPLREDLATLVRARLRILAGVDALSAAAKVPPLAAEHDVA